MINDNYSEINFILRTFSRYVKIIIFTLMTYLALSIWYNLY